MLSQRMSKGVFIVIDKIEAFDRLSILEIKYHAVQLSKTQENKHEISERIRDLEDRIIKAIGYKLFQKIKLSEDYNELFEANLTIFDGINLARQDKISGIKLNRLNEIRSEKKRNLDTKFFGNELKEIKIDENGEKII